jgi:hypothetical protein
VLAHIAAPVALQTSKSTLTSCHHVAVKESELSVHQIERERRHAAALRLGLVTRNAEKQGENIARLFPPTEPAYRDERARDEQKSPHATRSHRSDARFSPIAASNPRARIPKLIQTLD